MAYAPVGERRKRKILITSAIFACSAVRYLFKMAASNPFCSSTTRKVPRIKIVADEALPRIHEARILPFITLTLPLFLENL
jgi:hypothetical protein